MLLLYGLLSDFVGRDRARIRDAVAAAFRIPAKANRKINHAAISRPCIEWRYELFPEVALFGLGADYVVEDLAYRETEFHFANLYGWSHYGLDAVAVCTELLDCLRANVHSECLIKLIAHVSSESRRTVKSYHRRGHRHSISHQGCASEVVCAETCE